jgi:hypothetical protein
MAGSAYGIHVQMSESSGAEVFCMDLTVPLKTATPFVTVEKPSNIPAMSRSALIVLATLLVGVGTFVTWRRRARMR